MGRLPSHPLPPRRSVFRLASIVLAFVALALLLPASSASASAVEVDPRPAPDQHAAGAVAQSAFTDCSAVSEIPESECQALVDIYNATNGPSWHNQMDWLATDTPCSWGGVTCWDGHVDELDLGLNGLSGEMPAQVANLASLRRLYLGSNDFTAGPVPEGYQALTSLTYLDLSSTDRTGDMPSWIGDFRNLGTLYLDDNPGLNAGPIPPEYASLSGMQILDLSSTNRTGSMPDWIGSLFGLRRLDLTGNPFEAGSIPDSYQDLVKLGDLILEDTNRTGPMPDWIGSMLSLDRLYLGDNPFDAGPIPSAYQTMPGLFDLDLTNTNRTGPMPDWLANLPELRTVILSRNPFDAGPIPTSYYNAQWWTLKLAETNRTGALATTGWAGMDGLLNLDLSGNHFEGEIPTEFGQTPRVSSVWLQGNALSGDVPPSLTQLSLINLDLGYNKLTASDPTVIDFLNTEDPDWAQTQTVPPTNLSTGCTPAGVALNWTAIPYTGDTGFYQVEYATGDSGPWTVAGSTADKTNESYELLGLEPHTLYHFRVQTYTAAHDGQPNELWSAYGDVLAEIPCAGATDEPLTFTVNSTLDGDDTDPGDGICVTADDVCTYRAAIQESNARPAYRDTVAFDIPGAGPHTLTFTSDRPAITAPIVLDGTTEPDYVDTPVVVLDGNASSGDEMYGVTLNAHDSVVRGLAIVNFLHGIRAEGDRLTIQSNVIASNNGASDLPGTGIDIGTHDTLIGGPAPADGNVIFDHGGYNILVSVSSNLTIQNNYIGVEKEYTTLNLSEVGVYIAAGSGHVIDQNTFSRNLAEAVYLFGAETTITGNYFGIDDAGEYSFANGVAITVRDGAATISGNEIVGNDEDGIRVIDGGRALITQNEIADNGDLGIDLADDGVTPNDPGDADTGSNGLQNFPVLTAVQFGEGRIHLGGYLRSVPNATFTVEFFASTSCDPGGYGEGERYLGETSVTTDGSGYKTFGLPLDGDVTPGMAITATATDAAGHTSEFSACEAVADGARTFTVNSTLDDEDADPGDGVCQTAGEVCTLRAAMQEANAHVGYRDTVAFDIPGEGPHTIQPLSELPVITDPVALDATTQPGYAGQPLIELDGRDPSLNSNGLVVGAWDCLVRGFAISRFSSPLWLSTRFASSFRSDVGSVIQGNYIGTDVTGMVALGNQINGIYVYAPNTLIGGPNPGEGNLISGNGTFGYGYGGILVEADNVTIQGNIIGLNAARDAALGNGWFGVQVRNGADGTVIGGYGEGAGNIIAGNPTHEVLSDSSDIYIVGNAIGTDFSGTLAVEPDPSDYAHGVVVQMAAPNDIVVIENNLIAHHPDEGVLITSGFSGEFTGGGGVPIDDGIVTLRQNRIWDNGFLGIDLAVPEVLIYPEIPNLDGVTPNDPGDADTGPNGLQNFPVLTSAEAAEGGVQVGGSLNSTPDSSFTLEFFANTSCDPSGYGEGEIYLGETSVTTDGSGDASFSVSLEGAVTPEMAITATATDAAGHTSEFSACATVTDPAAVIDLITPLGATTDTTPRYRWTEVEGATGYNLWIVYVEDGRKVFRKTYAPRICNDNGVCAVTPQRAQGHGDYRWMVTAHTPDGEVASEWGTYSIDSAAPILIGPFGDITDTTPRYRWTAAGGATAYELLVTRTADGAEIFRKTYATRICEAGRCAVTPQRDLPRAGYTFRVQAIKDAGGVWSEPGQFTIH